MTDLRESEEVFRVAVAQSLSPKEERATYLHLPGLFLFGRPFEALLASQHQPFLLFLGAPYLLHRQYFSGDLSLSVDGPQSPVVPFQAWLRLRVPCLALSFWPPLYHAFFAPSAELACCPALKPSLLIVPGPQLCR